PERDRRRDAERVVDRRADVSVRRREQRGRAENALQPLLSPATRHQRTLVPRPGRPRRARSTYPFGWSARLNGRWRPAACVPTITREAMSDQSYEIVCPVCKSVMPGDAVRCANCAANAAAEERARAARGAKVAAISSPVLAATALPVPADPGE